MEQPLTSKYLKYYRGLIEDYSSAAKWLRPRIVKSISQYNISRIQKQRAIIIKHQSNIKENITKIKNQRYKDILIMRYLYHYKWLKIEKYYFGNYSDFEDEKHDKYKYKILYWHRAALRELRKVDQYEKTAICAIKRIKKLCSGEINNNLVNNILAIIRDI